MLLQEEGNARNHEYLARSWIRESGADIRQCAIKFVRVVFRLPDDGRHHRGLSEHRTLPTLKVVVYSTSPRNGNQRNRNHLDICLSSPVENRNSLAWVLPTNQASFVYSRGITYTDISDRKS